MGNYRASGLVGMMSYDDRHIFQADMRQDDLQRLTLKGAVLCAKRFGRCSWIAVQLFLTVLERTSLNPCGELHDPNHERSNKRQT